jgi:hypothetical protein
MITKIYGGSLSKKLLFVLDTIAKHGALKLIFHDIPENADEVILEKSIFLYLPHQENSPTINYGVHIRDLFTGRLITYKFLPIRNTEQSFAQPLAGRERAQIEISQSRTRDTLTAKRRERI